jgi:hypothetical protein
MDTMCTNDVGINRKLSKLVVLGKHSQILSIISLDLSLAVSSLFPE